jgi:hypothetical protein
MSLLSLGDSSRVNKAGRSAVYELPRFTFCTDPCGKATFYTIDPAQGQSFLLKDAIGKEKGKEKRKEKVSGEKTVRGPFTLARIKESVRVPFPVPFSPSPSPFRLRPPATLNSLALSDTSGLIWPVPE